MHFVALMEVRLDISQKSLKLSKFLLNGDHPQCKEFLNNISTFNSAFQMTSFGAKQITEGPFMPTLNV